VGHRNLKGPLGSKACQVEGCEHKGDNYGILIL
jgi:hypothetical protein